MSSGKELVKRLGVEIQKGDDYSFEQWSIVRESNSESSYEEGAVLTTKHKNTITKVTLLNRLVE
ncbi:unnamed protein product [Camellia sinensis]